jgi:hypothetical protein
MNQTYPDMETLNTAVGFLRHQSFLFLALFTSLGTLGLVLNSISLNIFNNRRFDNKPVYFYIRVMIVSSIVSNLLQVGFGVACDRHFLKLSNTYLAQVYIVMVFSPVHNTLTFYKFVIDSLCTLECIAKLRPWAARLIRFSPRVNSLIALGSVVFILLPHYFYYWPYKYHTLSEQDGLLRDFFMSDSSRFARTHHGKVIISSFLALRCLVIFVIDTSLNLILIYLFRRYQSRKARNLSCVIYRFSGSSNRTSSSTSARKSNLLSKEKIEKSVIKMVAVLSSISIVHQVILNANFAFTWKEGGVTSASAVSIFLANFSSALRHFSNFFIFYAFGYTFKAELKRKFQLTKKTPIIVNY